MRKRHLIRVIALSRSLRVVPQSVQKGAPKRLSTLRYSVSFSKHVMKQDEFDSTSVEHRLTDFHETFSDKSVDIILTSIGGHNFNQLLSKIDFDLIIKKHPKILYGNSDITILLKSIWSKAILVTYCGHHFSIPSEINGFDYTQDYFETFSS